jgi:hypothetical protein
MHFVWKRELGKPTTKFGGFERLDRNSVGSGTRKRRLQKHRVDAARQQHADPVQTPDSGFGFETIPTVER